MSDATPGLTITVGKDSKAVTLTDRLSLYEVPTITFALSDGSTWPAGSYTAALTYFGRTMTSVVCTNTAGVLTAALNLATTEIEAVFNEINEPQRLTFDMTLWDNTAHKEWARGKVDVWRANWSTTSATANVVPEEFYSGSTNITSGQSSVTVDLTSLGLAAAPSQILVTVKGPASAFNIFGTVTGTPTATQFVASLSAAPDQAGYILHWVVYP